VPDDPYATNGLVEWTASIHSVVKEWLSCSGCCP